MSQTLLFSIGVFVFGLTVFGGMLYGRYAFTRFYDAQVASEAARVASVPSAAATIQP
jgi:hypothetical protein